MARNPEQGLSIQKNMLWNSVGSLTNLVCQWLTTVLVVRLSTGFDAAGALSLAMSIGNVFAPIAQFKVRSYQVSDVRGETSAGEYVAFRLVTIAAALVVSGAYAALTASLSALPVIVLYLLYRCVDVFVDVLHGVDQQHLRMDFCGQSMLLRGVLSLAAFCAGLALTNSLEVAVAAMIAAVLPVVPLDWRRASRLDALRPRITPAKALSLFVTCLPAAVGVALCNLVTTVSRQSLAALAGTAALGVYSSVCAPIVIIQAGSSYVYAPLQGVFARHLDRGDRAAFARLLARVTLAMLGLTAVGLAGFALLGGPFLGVVFGADLASHADLMYLAIVSVAACAYCSFLCDLLIAMRAMASTLVCNLVPVCVAALTAAPLIGRFGANGTSLAVAAAYGVGIALMLLVMLRRLGGGGRP